MAHDPKYGELKEHSSIRQDIILDLDARIDALVAGGVTSVFGRTGLVVAVAGDYTASQVDVAFSPVNYTPATADVEAHLVALDAALVSDTNFGVGDITFAGNRTHDLATFNLDMINGGDVTWTVDNYTVTGIAASTLLFASDDGAGNLSSLDLQNGVLQLRTYDANGYGGTRATPISAEICYNDTGAAKQACVMVMDGGGGDPTVFLRTAEVDAATATAQTASFSIQAAPVGTQTHVQTRKNDAGTAVVGHVLTLQHATSGEAEWAAAPAGGALTWVAEKLLDTPQRSVKRFL